MPLSTESLKEPTRAHTPVPLAMSAADGASSFTWASDESVNVNYNMEEAQLLGRGKFSVVHRTTRRSDGRAVALKRIQARSALRPGHRARSAVPSYSSIGVRHGLQRAQ